ncbi:hypothetical protein EDC14_102520 [Hydrogenispora ethanolica]|uniref:ATP-binding protein n=1 Tax=Hydrogenispora ethanolica TaxID=1082276 RepID=A0A4R1R9L5_HYDET|nr:ATP-binding protein [Hydrogenispora ethanolica]TCL62401.1 hypothetical protein EDC14_102520 [Hydrogenispora ethanolica]
MKRLTVVGGAFGSGKTEFAIAYARSLAAEAVHPVGLVDLDIVNPYFRSRDVAKDLAEAGLEVISTAPGLEYADLPALSPQIYTMLQDRRVTTVFDVGGDPVGARALGRFYPYFSQEDYDFWVVINPYRPDTRDVDEAERLIAGLEAASRLRVTGLVGNINLGRETTMAIWRNGLPLIEELASRRNLPLRFHMVEEGFYAANREGLAEYPVFPVRLRMLPPWLQD